MGSPGYWKPATRTREPNHVVVRRPRENQESAAAPKANFVAEQHRVQLGSSGSWQVEEPALFRDAGGTPQKALLASPWQTYLAQQA